jgi:hypothetical protein
MAGRDEDGMGIWCRGPDRRTAARMEEGKALRGHPLQKFNVGKMDPRRLCGQNKRVTAKTMGRRYCIRTGAKHGAQLGPFVSAD